VKKKLDDFKVDTSAPADCTTTGLRLKLGRQSAKDPVKKIAQHPRPWQINQASEPLPINPARRPLKNTSSKLPVEKSSPLKVTERMKALSMANTIAQENNSKRKSLIPKLSGKNRSNGIQSDEGKENDSSASSQPVNNISRVSYLKKPGPKKHFLSLKQEHEYALQLLQELDEEENRRRSIGSTSSTYTDEDETSEHDVFEKANRGGSYKVTDSLSEDRASTRRDEYGELVSSGESETQQPIAIPDESFAWLPEGIQDASHLSIVLNDDIELQEEDTNTSSDEPSETCEQEDYEDDDQESSSSQSDEYLSDTSGY
jgi:hypothetical protein